MATPPTDPAVVPRMQGTLHIFVAFDWGDEILLDKVREIVPASAQELPRRRRTPLSFFYRPPPLRVQLPNVALELAELGTIEAAASATLFDFGAVSIALQIPFAATQEALLQVAGTLAESGPIINKARQALEPLHKQLQSAIQDPLWQDDLSEEYFVFQFGPESLAQMKDVAWLAGMVHLESEPLGPDEIDEALRNRLSYSRTISLVADWAAAVLVDRECGTRCTRLRSPICNFWSFATSTIGSMKALRRRHASFSRCGVPRFRFGECTRGPCANWAS